MAKPYVLSVEAISLGGIYPRIQRNIFYYDTFLTKCVATHFVKEVSSGN